VLYKFVILPKLPTSKLVPPELIVETFLALFNL